MTEIEISVLMESGKEHNLKVKSGSCSFLLAKLPLKMRSLIKKAESDGEKVLQTEVIFKGNWNMLILYQFTKGLDKRGIKWTWEL